MTEILNRVKAARLKLGLTQRALAELVGTSQQQIQRIETSKLAARLELATKLAAALRTPLARLFPAAAKPLRKVAKAHEERRAPDDEEIRELAKAGLEADARAWYFQARLRGHKESLQFQVSPTQQRWLFSKVQLERSHTEGLTFVIFETASDRIAINIRELVYCHVLFELSYFVEEEAPELSTSVEVFFSGDIEPVTFQSSRTLDRLITTKMKGSSGTSSLTSISIHSQKTESILRTKTVRTYS